MNREINLVNLIIESVQDLDLEQDSENIHYVSYLAERLIDSGVSEFSLARLEKNGFILDIEANEWDLY